MSIIPERLEAARNGTNPTVIRRMASGWAVLADWQKLPGYMILLADPSVESLNAVAGSQRQQFLGDMALLGDALLEVTDAYRINYQILGNLDPFLHAHVTPRYLWEPDDLRKAPTALYDRKPGPFFDPVAHRPLMDAIGRWLDRRGATLA